MNGPIDILAVVGTPPFAEAVALRCSWHPDADLVQRAGGEQVRIGSHVRDWTGHVVQEGPRSLPVALTATDAVVIVPLHVPPDPGRYNIDLDSVVEHRFWGTSLGRDVTTVRVERLQDGGLRFPELAPGLIEGTACHVGRQDLADFFAIARQYTPVVAATIGQMRVFVETGDVKFGRQLFVDREFGSVRLLRKVIEFLDARGFGFTRKTIVDIGAYIGTVSLSAIGSFAFTHTIAVEPARDKYLLFVQNLYANKIQHRAAVYNVALSDHIHDAMLEISTEDFSDLRIRANGGVTHDFGADIFNEHVRRVVRVPATTFDTLVRQQIIPVDEVSLVWIDTQGHAAHVLQGAQELLATDIPVVTEYWPYSLRRMGGLELYERLLAEHYTHFVDLGLSEAVDELSIQPTGDIATLRERYSGTAHSYLLLLKSAGRRVA